jgi:hypothetical protein
MKFKKPLISLALVGLVSTISFPALGQMFDGSSVYKVMRPDGTPQVIVGNLTPGGRFTLTYPGATSTRRVTTNPCGLAVLRDSSASSLSDLVSVNGANIDQAALPTQLMPRCVNGVLEEARPTTFKTGTGEVVFVATPNTVYEALYAGGRDRNVTANACGYAAINSTAALSWGDSNNQAFQIGGTAYNINTLPTASLEPLCRSGHLYMPAN